MPAADPIDDELARWLELPIAGGPTVLADGSAALFLSDESGVPRPWIVPLPRGDPKILWPGAERVGGIQAPRTQRRAIAAVDAGGDEHWQLILLDLPSGSSTPHVRALTSAPATVHLPGRWRVDGRRYAYASNARDPRFFDVLEIDVEAPDRPPAVRFRGDATHAVAAADDRRLLVARANTNLDADLFLVEEERTVPLTPHEGELTILGAALHRSDVIAAANPGREFTALVRYRSTGQGQEFLREYPGDVELVVPAPESDLVALAVNRRGVSEVHLVDLATGEDRVVNSGPRGVVTTIAWAPDAESFVYDVSSVDGQQVFRRDVATGKERRLAGPLATPKAVRAPLHAEFRASDRETVPYLDYVPAIAPRGTIFWIHGGPEDQARPRFSPIVQFLVTRGWRVVAPNVRGSTGYGRRFTHLDDVRKRMDSVRDLAELATELRRQGRTGPGGLGLAGGSYGGFMVLAAATEYPSLWGAAVDLVGIANFVTFLERTGPWRRALREAEYGSLANDRDFLVSISPLHKADRIVAPLLVIHGKNDPRVPYAEAEQIVDALRRLGRTVELLGFDDEGHGIVRRENRKVAWNRAVRWLEDHLAPPTAST